MKTISVEVNVGKNFCDKFTIKVCFKTFHRHSRWLYIQQQSSSSSSNRFIEHDEASCSIKRLLEDEELCCCFKTFFAIPGDVGFISKKTFVSHSNYGMKNSVCFSSCPLSSWKFKIGKKKKTLSLSFSLTHAHTHTRTHNVRSHHREKETKKEK